MKKITDKERTSFTGGAYYKTMTHDLVGSLARLRLLNHILEDPIYGADKESVKEVAALVNDATNSISLCREFQRSIYGGIKGCRNTYQTEKKELGLLAYEIRCEVEHFQDLRIERAEEIERSKLPKYRYPLSKVAKIGVQRWKQKWFYHY